MPTDLSKLKAANDQAAAKYHDAVLAACQAGTRVQYRMKGGKRDVTGTIEQVEGGADPRLKIKTDERGATYWIRLSAIEDLQPL
jgi:hypothetical protein